jgi:hypothetical protein
LVARESRDDMAPPENELGDFKISTISALQNGPGSTVGRIKIMQNFDGEFLNAGN